MKCAGKCLGPTPPSQTLPFWVRRMTSFFLFSSSSYCLVLFAVSLPLGNGEGEGARELFFQTG